MARTHARANGDGGFRLLAFSADPGYAAQAAAAGVDGIVVDWERRDKARRQADADTEINQDTPEDLRAVRSMVACRVLCRIDGPGSHTAEQLEEAITCGADEILLPMVRSTAEVAHALQIVAGRADLGILVETSDAVRRVDELAALPIAHAYVCLNDLAIERGTSSIFGALVDGTVAAVCESLRRAGVPCGFGGLTLPDRGAPVPCRLLIGEMARLGCSFSFLRRSFRRDTQGSDLAPALRAVRDAIERAGARSELDTARDVRDLAASVASWDVDGAGLSAGA